MFLAALFGGLLLSFANPSASLAPFSTVPSESHGMDNDLFVQGFDSGNGLRVLKKTWEDAAGGSLSLRLSEQGKEVSPRAQAGEVLGQGQAEQVPPSFSTSTAAEEKSTMVETQHDGMDMEAGARDAEGLVESFAFVWLADYVAATKSTLKATLGIPDHESVGWLPTIVNSLKDQKDRKCLDGNALFGGPVRQLRDLQIALRSAQVDCFVGEIALTSYQYNDETTDFYPVVEGLKLLLGRLSIDCGFDGYYDNYDTRMMRFARSPAGGADGYCTCVGYNPFPNLEQIVHFVDAETKGTPVAEDPLYSDVISPLTVSRIFFDRGDEPDNDTLNRVLGFPSLTDILQLVVERPNTGSIYFSTFLVHTLENAYLELNNLKTLMNEAQARDTDLLRGLSFRYCTNSFPDVAQLQTVSVANRYPFKTCSENERETANAIGVYTSDITCDEECLNLPSLERVAVLSDSGYKIGLLLLDCDHPEVRFNALKAIDMTSGHGFVLATINENNSRSIPSVQANQLSNFELHPKLLPDGWFQQNDNGLVFSPVHFGTTWQFGSLQRIFIDCSSLPTDVEPFCSAIEVLDSEGRNSDVGIIAPELDSIYLRYPHVDDPRNNAIGILLEGTPTVVELSKLRSLEFYGSFRDKVAVKVRPRNVPEFVFPLSAAAASSARSSMHLSVFTKGNNQLR